MKQFDTSAVLCWPGEDASPGLKRQILALEELAWPGHENDPWPEPEHLVSFCRLENGVLAAHAAVMGKYFEHRGNSYFACGLAEVTTHPAFRGKGLALDLIRRAAVFIREQKADLSVFTCAPELTGFYRRGGWEERPDLCLIGGSREIPFPSDREGLAVMFRLLSDRALAHEADFRRAGLFLELGEGKMW